MRLSVIDGCACPRPLFPVLRKLKAESGCTYNSIYRGDDAAGILHAHGKHTQRELFETLPAGTANPPGRSTHELRSDGVPYPGPIGRTLKWWQCGLDVNDSEIPAVIAAGKRLGWDLFQPYPTGTEYHHLNFRKRPARWRAIWHAVFGPKKPKHTVKTHVEVHGPSGAVKAPEHHKKHHPPAPRKMYDSVTVSEIPAPGDFAVAGYVGGLYHTLPALVKRGYHSILSIAVNSTENAECLDIEPGDATPADAAKWVKRQRARGIKRPAVYSSVSQMQQVLNALAAAGIKRNEVRVWTAHYTGHAHLCDSSCGFGFHSVADATQWTDHALGRNLDESLITPHFFA